MSSFSGVSQCPRHHAKEVRVTAQIKTATGICDRQVSSSAISVDSDIRQPSEYTSTGSFGGDDDVVQNTLTEEKRRSNGEDESVEVFDDANGKGRYRRTTCMKTEYAAEAS